MVLQLGLKCLLVFMVNKTVFSLTQKVLQLKTSERQHKNYGYGRAQRWTFNSSFWMKTHLSRALKCHFSGLTRISLWSCLGLANSDCVLNADTILPCSAPCSYFLVLETPLLIRRSSLVSVPAAALNEIKLFSNCDEECFTPVLSAKWPVAHYL